MSPALRDKKGHFLKGVSGNPGGGRKVSEEESKCLKDIRKLTPLAVVRLKEILEREELDKITLEAVKVVFNRTFGPEGVVLEIGNVEQQNILNVESSHIRELAWKEMIKERKELGLSVDTEGD